MNFTHQCCSQFNVKLCSKRFNWKHFNLIKWTVFHCFLFLFNSYCVFFRGHENVRVGAKEPDGDRNDAALVTFTDGSTHDYIPPDVRLNDGSRCLRLVTDGIGDHSCHWKCSYLCMSNPFRLQSKGLFTSTVSARAFMSISVQFVEPKYTNTYQ